MTPILHSPSGLQYAVGPAETPEIDTQLRTLFDKMGLQWDDGDSYLTKTYWNAYKHITAYCPAEGTSDRLNFYKCHPDQYTPISVTDFISLNTDSKPKRGDWVMVGNSEPPKHRRIFLAEIEGTEEPYVCVYSDDEAKFQKGEKVRTRSWPFMVPIVEPERAEPTNNRRALLENPDVQDLLVGILKYTGPARISEQVIVEGFIASELSNLDPKI